jgi:mannose-6-phosphate isomerase
MLNFLMLEPLQVSIQYHARVWGGQHLKRTTAPETPIGEAWVIHEHNQVQGGAFAGRTLQDLAKEYGAALLGQKALERTGARFPLLIKILDCADWLSIQVHPNDAQAVQLEGAGQFGKTEAWHLMSVENNAELISGVKPGVTPAQLETAIRSGAGVRDIAQYQKVRSGDTVMMHAGTMHALGPGMLLYEVQQTSDITYRVYDWDRPASAGRALHIEQSVAVTIPSAAPIIPAPQLESSDAQTLTECPYFVLEKLQGGEITSSTNGSSFHAITITEGAATLESQSQTIQLEHFGTVIIPADSAPYTLKGAFQALRCGERR